MLRLAHYYSVDDINKKITEMEPYRKRGLDLTMYTYYSHIGTADSEYSSVRYVSVSKDDEVLAVYTATYDLLHEYVSSLYLVNFNKKDSPDSIKQETKADLKEFIELLYNDPRFRHIQLVAIADNPANKLYKKWIEEYGGYCLKEKQTIKMPDTKFYDKNRYYINTARWNREAKEAGNS